MLRRKLSTFQRLVPLLGAGTALKWGFYHLLAPNLFSRYKMHPRELLHPLTVRGSSSDLDVFQQIFVNRQYDCLVDIADGGLIIDCGGNVGYSSAYFLSRFPKTHVIAIEPDTQNFAMLQHNMTPYGERAKPVHAGVWSHSVGLVISEDKFRDGREWSIVVRPCRPDEKPQFQGVDIGTLLTESKFDRISVLKIDVEGAEAVIFKENYQSWLNKVDNIAIELHNDSKFGNAHDIFFAAIKDQGFQISYSGELTICHRKS